MNCMTLEILGDVLIAGLTIALICVSSNRQKIKKELSRERRLRRIAEAKLRAYEKAAEDELYKKTFKKNLSEIDLAGGNIAEVVSTNDEGVRCEQV